MKQLSKNRGGLLGRAGALCLMLIGLLIGFPGHSHAELSTSFQVSATIVEGCEINQTLPANNQAVGSIGTLDFGNYPSLTTGPVSAALVQDMGFRISCTPSVALSMSLDAGENVATARRLRLSGGTDHIPYALYADPGFAQELAINQPHSISFSGNGAIILPIYGRLTLSGNSAPGTYEDMVRVTLVW